MSSKWHLKHLKKKYASSRQVKRYSCDVSLLYRWGPKTTIQVVITVSMYWLFMIFYVVEYQISVRPLVDLNSDLWSWDSCRNLGISSHLGTIVSAAAIWNTSHWFHVLTNNAYLVRINPMCWGVQYCDTLSCCLQSHFSSLHPWVLYPKSKERLGGTWRCCALHHRYLEGYSSYGLLSNLYLPWSCCLLSFMSWIHFWPLLY